MRRVTGSFNDSSNNEPTKSKMTLEYLTRDLKKTKTKTKKTKAKQNEKNKNKKNKVTLGLFGAFHLFPSYYMAIFRGSNFILMCGTL